MLLDGDITDEVAQYITRKKVLTKATFSASQGAKVGNALAQDNIRLLFGFYRRDLQ